MTAFPQNSGENIIVSRIEYQSLLIAANITVDNLKFKIKELEIVNKALQNSRSMEKMLQQNFDLAIAKNQSTIEGMKYQMEKMNNYVRYLKKRVRKAWFNGIWQGNTMMAVIVAILILL